MPFRFLAKVVSRREHGLAVEQVLEVSEGFRARPGQFVHVDCGSEGGRVLRRPFSIFDLRDGALSLLIKPVGPGSSWLAARAEGQTVDLLGPLGRGFETPREGACALLAGGTGIAPLHFLLRRLRGQGAEATLFWGMEKGEDFGDLPRLLQEDAGVLACSMDGCLGFKGDVLELFRSRQGYEAATVYACGPRGMLVDLAETMLRGDGLFFQASLEERMACGVGACRGCAVPAAGGGYLSVCSDGPVFDGGELDWKGMSASIWQ